MPMPESEDIEELKTSDRGPAPGLEFASLRAFRGVAANRLLQTPDAKFSTLQKDSGDGAVPERTARLQAHIWCGSI